MTMTIWSETYGIVLLSLTLSSPAAAGRAVEDLSVRHLLEQILTLTLLAQSLLEIHPLTVHRVLRLGEKALQGQVGVLTRMVAVDVVRVVVLLREVDVVRVVVVHLVVGVVALRRSVPLRDQPRLPPIQELHVSCDVSQFTRRGSSRTSPSRTIATRSHSWNMHTP